VTWRLVTTRLRIASGDVSSGGLRDWVMQLDLHEKSQAANPQAGQPRPAAPAPEVTQQGRWDYKTVVMTHGFMGFKKGELDRKEFEKNLDELGSQGFELVWILTDQKLHFEKDGHVMLFKRWLSA
jgi:hypothetical protein